MDLRHGQEAQATFGTDDIHENPLIDGFFEWMDSPEGERATEVLDTLNLQQSIEHIQKQCPDFSVEEVEGHLLYWVESGYSPHNCSQQ